MGFSNCLVIVIFNHCEELIAFFPILAKKKKKWKLIKELNLRQECQAFQ